MRGRFTGACADAGPGDSVDKKGGADRVQQLGSDGQAHLGYLEQQFARDQYPFFDLVLSVDIGVINEAFPAKSGPRLLKVDPHDDEDFGADLPAELPEPLRILKRGLHVMNGAWAQNDEQSLRVAIQDGAELAAVFLNGCSGRA